MDFNDDRSIFSNNQLLLDMQNVPQNDYLQTTNYDSHMLSYFVNDDPNYSQPPPISNQCEQNVVLCSNQQSSNSLKAQNSAHSQPTNLNNRSRNQHHFFQQQQPHNQFHNQTSTSSKQFLTNIPQINQQQQISYVNVPNKNNDPIIYSQEVVNRNSIYNKKDTNLYHANQITNNGVNQMQQQPHQRLPPQINNLVSQNHSPPEIQMKPTNNNLINKAQTAYSNETNLASPSGNILAPTKNGNNDLLIKNTVQPRTFYSPPPNYIDIHGQDNLQANKFNGNVVNGLNYFNDKNNNTNVNNNLANISQIKMNQTVPDKLITNCGNVLEKNEPIQNMKISNLNSISSNSNLQDNKSQTNELNNKLVDLDKAETKSIIIFKIIDQVVYNGKVVKETILKNEEIVKHTGFIDWPINAADNLVQTSKDKKDSKIDKNFKKVSPKTNLKRSIKQNTGGQAKESKQQEKKIKVDVDQIPLDQNNPSSSSLVVNDSTIDKNANNLVAVVEKPVNDVSKAAPEVVDKKIEIVPAKQIQQPTLSILNPIEEPVFIQIDVKTEVFAKWNDKNYYSGTVLKKESDGKWKIKFDDGASKLVREEEILNIEFIPRNQAVMFTYSNNFCAKGVVKNYRLEKTTNQKYYLIEHLVNSKYVETEYKAEDVFLNSEAGLSLLNKRKQNANDTKFADVDLNNIIPRTQRSRITNKNDNSTNTSEKTTPLGSEIEMIDNDSNSNLSCSTTSSSTTVKKQKKTTTKGTNKQLPQPNTPLNDEKNNTNSIELTTSNVSNNDSLSDDDLLGPILVEGSNLFKNFSFMFSFDAQVDENEAGFSIPFDLERLKKQIRSGSGLLLDNFEDIKDNSQTILISHSFSKTIKYLSCIAQGIYCVKYTFIIDSCKKNELVKLENYILPTGSSFNNQLIQDRNIYKKSQSLFKGTKIYLISLNESTLKWLPLLKATKSIIIDKLPDTPPNRKPNCTDLMVTDQSCPAELLNKANQFKVPIVSIEYIIASLIHGKRLSLNLHPNFQYNFVPNK